MGSVKGTIERFYKLLDKYPDNISYVGEFSNFFMRTIRSNKQQDELPLIEMMTILKDKRPIISYMMKKNRNMMLNMLLEMEMDYEEAENKLKMLTR